MTHLSNATLARSLALALLTSIVSACGEQNELESIEGELGGLEAALRNRPGDRSLCIAYGSICERATALCLPEPPPSEEERCESLANRCDANLAEFCSGVFPPSDGGPFFPDGGIFPRDGGPLRDGNVPPRDGGARPDGDIRPPDSGPPPDGGRRPPDSGPPPDGDLPDAGQPPDAAMADCIHTGCSGQVCSDHEVVTTCEWRPEYACYATATCERQADGECDWTPTDELLRCLENGGPPET